MQAGEAARAGVITAHSQRHVPILQLGTLLTQDQHHYAIGMTLAKLGLSN